jgi:hypothetical protein
MKFALAVLLSFSFAIIPCAAETYFGRVETVEQGSAPKFPSDILEGGAREEVFPDELLGRWYGRVEVAQLATYDELHGANRYGQAFIREVRDLFKVGQPGQVVLDFKKNARGEVVLTTSDVILRGRLKLRFTADGTRGNGIVRGTHNYPRTVANRVHTVGTVVDQTRIDQVHVVDDYRNPVQTGYTEISAQYALTAPKRMSIKLLEVDYDSNNNPLWKILIRGTASR